MTTHHTVTIGDMLADVRRELSGRKNRGRRWLAGGTLTDARYREGLAVLEAVIGVLEDAKENGYEPQLISVSTE